ncbi:MAG: polysaccharide deacetylase family protein [Candidatus Pelagibacter sp.]
MIVKKILFVVASIIKSFIVLFLLILNSKSEENNIKYYSKDLGTLSLMYHRFNENKYPSTNIQMDIFKKQINIIKNKNYEFEIPKNFDLSFNKPKTKKKILITIDDAFTSFYENAWPFLKENKIPFILFVSTQPVGKKGYMTWEQIKEVEKENFAFIGNHSHSHEYLLDFSFTDFKKDIDNSIKIFNEKLGYNPIFFSYPFGEYSLEQVNYIKEKFKYAFGQHSGVIDFNKDIYELPRFPINEKYGDLERFNFLIDLLPLQYKNILPKDKYIKDNNPPKLIISFFKNQKNLKNINCFSDEGNKWDKSDIVLEENKLIVNFREKFIFRRGRINCSLNDSDGWKWFGVQFSVKLN